MKLTYQARKRLPDSAFALEKKRKYPIHDKAHARNALARVSAYGTPAEKREVRREVCEKYPDMGQCAEKRSSFSLAKYALSAAKTQKGLSKAKESIIARLLKEDDEGDRAKYENLLLGVIKNLSDPHAPGGERG